MNKVEFDFSLPWKDFCVTYINSWYTQKQLYNKRYRQKHLDELRAYDKKYHIKNKEKKDAYNHEYYKKNRENIIQRHRNYARENKDKLLEQNRDYYSRHKEEMRKKKQKIREERKYKKIHDQTQKEINKRWWYPKKCAICERSAKIYAHHPDYNKWNEVVFVCSACHSWIHRWEIICPTPINLLDYNNNNMDYWKLIELINEHQKEIHPDGIYLPVVAYRHWLFYSDSDCLSWVMDEIHLISKYYWFIKWLVENDKINFELPMETLSFREYYDIKKSDFLIALLSIQDEPIRFLCEILK